MSSVVKMRLGWSVFLLLAGVWLAGLAGGCEKETPVASPIPQSGLLPIKIGSKTFACEVANNPRKREFGLMLRESLPENRGMLFVFTQEQVLSFWMKYTLIPLDIIFVDKEGKVVTIRQMKPQDETTTSSEKPVLYAIELNAGAAEKAGIRVGAKIEIPGDLPVH